MNLEKLAKERINDLLKPSKDFLIDDAMSYLNNLNQDSINTLPDNIKYNLEIFLDEEDLEKIMFKLISTVVLQKSVTAQQLTGMVFNKLRRNIAKKVIVDILLNAVEACKFIKCRRVGMYLMFESTQALTKEIEDKKKQYSYILPSIDLPLTITDNTSIGYRSVTESVICGGYLKHHDLPLNLTHINKLNRNPYRVETRLQFLVKPKFNPEPKLKDNGEMESDLDVSRRLKQFNQIISELPEKTRLLCNQGNRFYIHHKFDNGGRTYAKAYHLNYQGMAYSKAQVQAYNKEIVEPDF